ncbi:hypothetical protein GCM10020295_75860 [Streptomyces cinereospinus]
MVSGVGSMRGMTDEPDRPAHYREPRQARSAATLARILRAAEELASSAGLEDMTMTGVAERADVSVGTIYRRFEDKEQLITALAERMLERREEYVAEQLEKAEPSLAGVVDAYAHALLESFADSGNLFPELLRARTGAGVERRGADHHRDPPPPARGGGPLRPPDPTLRPGEGPGRGGPRPARSLLPQLGAPRLRHRCGGPAPVRRRTRRHGDGLPAHPPTAAAPPTAEPHAPPGRSARRRRPTTSPIPAPQPVRRARGSHVPYHRRTRDLPTPWWVAPTRARPWGSGGATASRRYRAAALPAREVLPRDGDRAQGFGTGLRRRA